MTEALCVHKPEHDQSIGHNIRNTQPQRHDTRPLTHRLIPDQILEHHHSNAARQPARHERETEEQHQPRLPRHPASRVREAITRQPRLLDRIDDQHAQRGTDQRDPVHEGDVQEGGVEG